MEKPDNSDKLIQILLKPQTEYTLIDRRHTLVDGGLIILLDRRLGHYLFREKVLVNGEETWCVFLIGPCKKQQFLEKVKTGFLKFEDFGTISYILVSGVGDLPQEIDNINASKLISNNLIKLTLQKKGYDETYYVLCDPEKKLKILEATTAEEIQQHGKILYAALDREPIEIISLAIIKGIFNGSSPEIDFTVRNRHIEALWDRDLYKLEEYLNDDANATAVDHNGWNLLHYCALWGGKFEEREELIYRLASTKLNASAEDNWGRLPRHIAAKEGRLEAFYFYMTKGIGGIEKDCNGWTDMHYAAWKGNSDCVNLLLSNYAPINTRDKCLGKTPLLVASEQGHTEIIELLLEYGNIECGLGVSDCDVDGETPLLYAAESGHVETARFLIERNANVEARRAGGLTPLHAAATTENNADMIELLISYGSKLDSKGDSGHTPLHYAAALGHLNNVKFLVEKGFSESDCDDGGCTPLFYAAKSGHVETARFLIGSNSNVEARMVDGGLTPLHVSACTENNADMIKLLISQGSKLDSKDDSGLTPLHHAAYLGHINNVQFLVEKGANVNALGNRGGTPLDLAKHCQREQVTLYLSEKTAKWGCSIA